MNSFERLGLSATLARALEKINITEPTEIQSRAIPHALDGRDLMASSETGSGKTAAFLLPLIQRLARRGSSRALILAPTRELALQIESNAKIFGHPYRLRAASIVGGQREAGQLRALDSAPDIIVATPGRLNDFLNRQLVSLRAIQFLVLDEADRMLDMGFLPQVRRIIHHLPRQRQTMLLSATLSREVERLAREMLSDPVRVEAARKTATVATLVQKAYPVLSHAKAPLLLAIMRQHTGGSFLVFTETKRSADQVARVLTANRHSVATLHSDRTQSQRNAALEDFKRGRVSVLVATDVAARGIDVDDISHVVNYDVPLSVESYLHRVGRTARAGRQGAAFTLVSPGEEAMLAIIERSAGISLERSRLSGFSDGRTDQQIMLATEIGRLRSSSARSVGPRR